MSMANKLPFSIIALLFVQLPNLLEAQLGVCNGRFGNNLPSPQDTVNLYNSKGIGAMRLYDPDQATLQAVQGTNIKVLLTVPNDQVQSLGSDQAQASQWVQTNVAPYASSIKYIAVGNEIHPSDQAAPSVGPALQNVQNAVNSANLGGQIKVSTAIDMKLIKDSSPPSSGAFTDMGYMGPILNFLTSNQSPLLVNVYPYVAYKDNPVININYALSNPNAPVVNDNGKQYQSLFDAQVDSVYAALAKAGAPNTAIVVSESGWPSHGGDPATTTMDNAGSYYRNLIGHISQGTPLKPGPIETYLFAMFDENEKTGAETEQYFGLFTPDQHQKYNLDFNG